MLHRVEVSMLELRNVSKGFSGILAVEKVSFTARAGEVTGYLGPDGSGKSTTMKMITGSHCGELRCNSV
jgi:ABC-2 type transport system ATP-binding protein